MVIYKLADPSLLGRKALAVARSLLNDRYRNIFHSMVVLIEMSSYRLFKVFMIDGEPMAGHTVF